MATMLMSRYDVLKVDGLDSDDDNKSRKGNKQKQQQKKGGDKQKQQKPGGVAAAVKQNPKSATQKQQNNKEKQTSNQEKKATEINSEQHNKPRNASGGTKNAKSNQKREEARWEEWKKIDDTAVEETFEKDLHMALIASRHEYERMKQIRGAEPPEQEAPVAQDNTDDPASTGSKKKKARKAKAKPTAMTLQQFNTPSAKSNEKKSAGTENGMDLLPLRLHPEGEANPNYFDDLEADADKVLQQGKSYDAYQKQFVQENVRIQKLEGKLKRRDMEIAMLQTSIQKKEDEYQQVKKRNKQLLVILSQGEMKDKAEILIQADNLSQINGELTEQVTALNGDLEKERSKVHSLEAEIERLKTSGRHHSGK